VWEKVVKKKNSWWALMKERKRESNCASINKRTVWRHAFSLSFIIIGPTESSFLLFISERSVMLAIRVNQELVAWRAICLSRLLKPRPALDAYAQIKEGKERGFERENCLLVSLRTHLDDARASNSFPFINPLSLSWGHFLNPCL